ncbi:serine-rich adhesin for platelets-like [Mercenaria mercenaria]|uniref:serine-rich adhesin for platelets-like n=1 Tax=Mercenaria mercenaria TaxID=6596 RepID=UPI00234F23FF|nr:serine-rich adhesin for platelets-like [Mercenaria mercenaria]
MNQKNQKKMDKKKTKRRKSNAGKRHGRAEPEEKPKTVEVMNEKEKQDRLEAASVLSSLMFFPPKSSEENENSESGGKNDLVTPSTTVTQFTLQPSTSGIPTTSQPTYLVQRGGRGGTGSATLSENATNLKNSMILAQLQSQLNLALKNRNVQPVFHPQAHAVLAQNKNVSAVKPGLTAKYVTNDKPDSQNVPLTVLKQNLTVNKNVAKALRQVVSNNKLKAEIPQTENTQKKVTGNSETASACVTAPRDEHEKMECESLPSSQWKAGSTDTNLPLKKRRLIGMNDGSLTTSDLNLNSSTFSTNLDTLTSTRQIENILQMAKDYPAASTAGDSTMSLVSNLSQPKLQSGEGYRPVHFDPRTSLMVLSDLKFALTPDEDGDLPIHIAVVHENTELVKKFIDIMAISGKTVDRFNKLQQTPLHLAVLVNKPEIVSVLLAAGANPNLQDRNGYTCMHISVNKEQPSCVDTLFGESKYPISLNTRDYEGYYPLHSCVELDNMDMMMSLIAHGADKDCQDGKAGRSVLFYAVEYNRGGMVQYLLDQGATPDLQNYASVTPMMTAQAASYEDIVACLNKALDIGNKYEDSYLPSKKVPISKIPSKSAQIVNKDMKVGRLSISGDIPLIYQEFETGSHSLSDDFKKEPLSRQSSVSSPIDLSMRHSMESPQLPVEMSIRGKPGRRKTKKELKNHKEKHPQKSMVKEKHASVVAALERSMFADKSYSMKANGKASEADHRQVETYIKVEATDAEDVEMRNKDEREEIVDVETVRTKSSSEALSNFILNLKPEQTKQLVEKVKQQLSVQKSDNTRLTPDAPQMYAAESPSDNKRNNFDNSKENDMERMHQDLETDGVEGEKTEKGLQDETPMLTDKDEYSEMVVSENESNVAQTEEVTMDDDCENRAEIVTKENIESPVTAVQFQCTSQSPDADHSNESDLEEIVVYRSHLKGDKDNTENTVGSPCEKKETCSENISSDGSKSFTLTSAYEGDKSCMLGHAETMSKDTQESDEECINKRSDGINDEEISDSVIKDDRLEPSNSKELVSQISQESASSSSLHGSQGFEAILSPALNINPVRETDGRQLENSEDSMEVDFTGNTSVSRTVNRIETGTDADVSDAENTTAAGDNDDTVNKTLELKMTEKNSKVSMDTDEDDEDTGLVIDEHASGDESVNNIKNCETVTRNESINVSKQTDCEWKEKTVNFHVDAGKSVEVKTTEDKRGYSEDLNEVENGNIGKQVEENVLKSSVKDKGHMNSEKPVDVEKQVISNGKNIGSSEKSSEVSDGKESAIEPRPQGIQDEEKLVKPSSAGLQLSQGTAPDDLLKKGQSHTLYYHDGDSYKPVKIFIDNSEQSSLVLQRMFQTAQLSNVNRQTGLITADNTKTATQSSFSETRTSNSVYPNVTVSHLTPATNRSVVQSDLVTEVRDYSISKATTSFPSNLNVETVSVTNIRPSAHALNALATEPSFQQAYIKSLKHQASNEAAKINGSAKQTKKQTVPISTKSDIPCQTKTVSQNTKQKVLNTSKSFDSRTSTVDINERNQKFGAYIATLPPGKRMPGAVNKSVNFLTGKYTSEGTLTRVNPDVRNKLSKALQSPQRKVGLVKSDSDSYIVNNRGVLGNVVTSVSGTASASVTDSRQQL